MLETKIQSFISKLTEQSKLAKSKNTLAGLFDVMYGFIEIIENDKIFLKFIKAKVNEENHIHNKINEAYRNKSINNETWHGLSMLHISDKFWNGYLSSFKDAHDLVKSSRDFILGNEIKGELTHEYAPLFASDPFYLKKLTKEEWLDYYEDFDKCIVKIKELINSDPILLAEIYNEHLTGTAIQNSEEFSYKLQGDTGRFKYGGDDIEFKGVIALVVEYLINNSNDLYKDYNDFNKWAKLRNIDHKTISSNDFRLKIAKINKRISTKFSGLHSIIETKEKGDNNPTERGRYKLQMCRSNS